MQKVHTRIESIVGNVVTVRSEGVRYGDIAMVGDSFANVIKLDRDIVSLQVFAGGQGVSTTDPVKFLGRPMMVSFSDDLLGRIFNGAGVPIDRGPELTGNMITIGGPSFNPARRIVQSGSIQLNSGSLWYQKSLHQRSIKGIVSIINIPPMTYH